MTDDARGPTHDHPVVHPAVHTVLADGTPVALRLAFPGDETRIIEGFERCSAATRYLRFLSGGYELTPERLVALTHANRADHVVWLMACPDEPGAPIGLARFVRLTNRPHAAEVAFIVVDEFQGRGAGRLFLDALRVSAGEREVTTFTAEVLSENAPMKALLLHRGARVVARDGPELNLEIAVADCLGGVSDPPVDEDIRALFAD